MKRNHPSKESREKTPGPKIGRSAHAGGRGKGTKSEVVGPYHTLTGHGKGFGSNKIKELFGCRLSDFEKVLCLCRAIGPKSLALFLTPRIKRCQ